MSGFVAALVLSYFLMTSLMTFRLFKRPVKEPFGATFITVAAVLGTLANITLWWRLPPADGGLALAMIALAIPLYVLAVRASHGQVFGVPSAPGHQLMLSTPASIDICGTRSTFHT